MCRSSVKSTGTPLTVSLAGRPRWVQHQYSRRCGPRRWTPRATRRERLSSSSTSAVPPVDIRSASRSSVAGWNCAVSTVWPRSRSRTSSPSGEPRRLRRSTSMKTTRPCTDFGWHVGATDPAYRELLEQLVPAAPELPGLALVRRRHLHVSDEPHGEKAARHLRRGPRGGRSTCSPAAPSWMLSATLASTPERHRYRLQWSPPTTVAPFLDARSMALGLLLRRQQQDVANRFVGLPLASAIVFLGTSSSPPTPAGFLHWGFNFYNSVSFPLAASIRSGHLRRGRLPSRRRVHRLSGAERSAAGLDPAQGLCSRRCRIIGRCRRCAR